jgi:hypothetical protein
MLSKAYFQLGITAKDKFNILETVGTNKFKVSNGIGITEPVTKFSVSSRNKWRPKISLGFQYTNQRLIIYGALE